MRDVPFPGNYGNLVFFFFFWQGCICATQGFCDREENCFDFLCIPLLRSSGDKFSHEKAKNDMIFLDRESFVFQWEG